MLFKRNRIIRNKEGIITLERYHYGGNYENKNMCDSCNLHNSISNVYCSRVLGFTTLTAMYICSRFGLANINVKYRYMYKSYNIC